METNRLRKPFLGWRCIILASMPKGVEGIRVPLTDLRSTTKVFGSASHTQNGQMEPRVETWKKKQYGDEGFSGGTLTVSTLRNIEEFAGTIFKRVFERSQCR